MQINITLDVPEGTTVTVNGVPAAQPFAPIPPAPLPPPPAPPAAPVGDFLVFPWDQSGLVRQEDFGTGTLKVYALDVPADFMGTLVGNISQSVSGTPEYSNVDLWFSETPDGDAYAGDLFTRNPEPSYHGPTGQTGLGTPAWMPPKGKRVYFNVRASGRWNVRVIR